MKRNDKQMLVLARSGCSLGVVILAGIIAVLLFKTRPETKTQDPKEPVIAVNLMQATHTNLTVNIETQGIVKPIRQVQISPQVSGKVIEMPRQLKAGELVKKDELLLKIDPVDYETRLAEAKASVARLEAGLELIRINETSNRKQLEMAERSRNLAKKDYERAKKLSEEGQAVSVAVVDSSEQAVTQAENQVLQLKQALAQVPGRLEETESELTASRARLEQSKRQLARTEIRAPFSGRILQTMVEEGEILQPGGILFEIADDSVLEIAVPVTASDLRNWIPFAEARGEDQGWFAPLAKVPVEIRWAESSKEVVWQGELDRIIRFDATTRTAMLAVRISGSNLVARNAGLPLTEGMFCQVTIPGKKLKDVIAIPRSAVTFDNKCYLSVDGVLKTVDVEIVRSQSEYAYISSGVEPGDRVITTRLVAPLEGVKLVEVGE